MSIETFLLFVADIALGLFVTHINAKSSGALKFITWELIWATIFAAVLIVVASFLG